MPRAIRIPTGIDTHAVFINVCFSRKLLPHMTHRSRHAPAATAQDITSSSRKAPTPGTANRTGNDYICQKRNGPPDNGRTNKQCILRPTNDAHLKPR